MKKSIFNLLHTATQFFMSESRNDKPESLTSPHKVLSDNKRILTEQQHKIPRNRFSPNAVRTVFHLLNAGHETYLVGGCVRDLLLGKYPKDFDVTTAAHPEVAEQLFKRGKLIGRRFKLLHVRFGRELIEVATFRANHEGIEPTSEYSKKSANGLLLRDNVYGSIEEDALRRDFTVNALYIDLQDYSIIDFTHGYEDLLQQTLRIIGDPDKRYQEDPVRMLRAARLAAKLDFKIDPDTAKPIYKLAPLLSNISPARLFDESLKLLQSGYAIKAFDQLQQYHLFSYLFPLTQKLLDQQHEKSWILVQQVLMNTDNRLQNGKSVTPAFLFAALLWYPLQERMQHILQSKKVNPNEAMHEARIWLMLQQNKATSIPKRFSLPMREIWELQLRLPQYKQPQKAYILYAHPRFRAAYDLVLLREAAGEDLQGLGDWWTHYQENNPRSKTRFTQRNKTSDVNKDDSL